jgi:ABC-type Fe3+-hydroxamate transport system substrate-binding protein
MIERVGALVDKIERSQYIISEIRKGFETVQKLPSRKVLYLIWRKPWMAAGQNTFINDMLSRIGLRNCLPESSRYPELSNDEMISLNPEVVFLSSEPYPFKEKHIAELQSILSQSKIMLVDGEMFSWYGSRLMKAGEYCAKLDLT